MNNSALDTNKKRKAHMEHFMEFCALPPTGIAEIPLGLLYFPNKWVTTAFEWLSDGPLSEWMSDFKHNHPRIFWCTSVTWLPIILIAGLYGGLLVSAGAVWVVVFLHPSLLY